MVIPKYIKDRLSILNEKIQICHITLECWISLPGSVTERKVSCFILSNNLNVTKSLTVPLSLNIHRGRIKRKESISPTVLNIFINRFNYNEVDGHRYLRGLKRPRKRPVNRFKNVCDSIFEHKVQKNILFLYLYITQL